LDFTADVDCSWWQVSNVLNFEDSSPQLLYGYSQYSPSPDPYLATGKDAAGNPLYLTVAGTYGVGNG
jgi:hypothetical protein